MAFRNSPVQNRPGYAWLDIDAAVTRDVTFRLSCPNRQSSPWLGQGGWQGSPYDWRPEAIEGAPTGARLQVGPRIVDQLQSDVLVRIEIPSADYRADTWWDPVPVSGTPLPDPTMEPGDGPSGDGANVRPVIIDPPRPAPAPPPTADARTAVPRQGPTTTAPSGIADPPPTTIDSAGTGDPSPQRGEFPKVDGPPPKGGRMIAAAAALLGLIIGLVSGYVYVSADRATAAAAAAAAPAASADEAVRLLASREPQAERLYRVGMDLRETADGSRDIALQAIQRAAALEYAPAQLWLARTADPARHEWKGARAKPDAAAALEGYAHVGPAGSNDAAVSRIALCSYMRSLPEVTDAGQRAVTAYCN